MNTATTKYPTRRSLREAEEARRANQRAVRATERPVTARQTEKMWHSEMSR